MPVETNERIIRIRQVEPTEFIKKSFRTIRLTKGVKAIIGKKKGQTNTSIQSLLFDKKVFSEESAKEWSGKHHSKFSAAVTLENKKISMFQEPEHMMLYHDGSHYHEFFDEHLDGHLPKLTSEQIQKILEFVGYNKTEEVDEMKEDEIGVDEMKHMKMQIENILVNRGQSFK